MRKLALVMAAAIALSSVNVGALEGMKNNYTVSAATKAQKKIENKLFDAGIINNSATYQLKDGVLTVSGTGIADNSYRKTIDVNSVKEVVLKPGITAIGDHAFEQLKNLKKITIPNTVTSLGFYSLAGLKMDSIVIPNSVKTIGIHCMEKGTIKSVTMPGKFVYKENVEGEEERGYTEELRYTILPNTDVVKLNTTFSPSMKEFFHTAKKVQTFKEDQKYKTFGDCIYTKNGKKLVFVPTSVKNLKIRKGCKTVSLESFCYAYEPEDWLSCYCKNLKTVDVPSTVKKFVNDIEHHEGEMEHKSLEYDPLEKCKFVFHTKKLNGNILSVLNREYIGKGKAKFFAKEYGVKKKDGMYISYDHVLIKYEGKKKKVTIPKNIKKVAPFAFYGSVAQNIKVPSNWKQIDDWACGGSNIRSVKMSNKIKTIGEGAFYGTSIKKLVLSKKLKSIGNKAFEKTALTSVVIPNSVRTCGDYCFAGAKKLKKVTLSKNMTAIPEGMFENTAITKVTIPGKIKKIGQNAFVGTNLKKVDLQEGVESFFVNSFLSKSWKDKDGKWNRNDVQVSIPKSLEKIQFSIKKGYEPKKIVFTYSKKSDLSNAQTKIFENTKEMFDVKKLDRTSDIYCKISYVRELYGGREETANLQTYHFTFK